MKDYVKKHARLIMVHTTKTVPTLLAETEDFCMAITDEFLERTDGWKVSDQLLESGPPPTPKCTRL